MQHKFKNNHGLRETCSFYLTSPTGSMLYKQLAKLWNPGLLQLLQFLQDPYFLLANNTKNTYVSGIDQF
jgi:hypothetical protein